MILTAGSIVLAAVALASMFVLSRKNRAGWVLSVAFSGLAIPYDIYTKQYGFVATSVVGLFIAVSAFVRWGREADSDPPSRA